MNSPQKLALVLCLAATSLHALPRDPEPPNPGPPPPPGCPRDLQKAQADLATSQDNLTKCQANAAKSPATSPDDALAKAEAKLNDWPQLHRYAADNAALPPAGDPNNPATAASSPRVVFYGDSITDGWGRQPDTGDFFPGQAPEADAYRNAHGGNTDEPRNQSGAQAAGQIGKGAHVSASYINRGISGQTTPQMLVRFQQDVVHLHPAAVLILAATNDIAGNTGPSTPQMIEDNFISMTDIARASGIKVILASITPAYSYPWKPGVDPVPTIRELNAWLKDYCTKEGLTYLDYYSAMSDEKGAMKPGLAKDGVHPTAQGYAIMGPLAEAAIAQALVK